VRLDEAIACKREISKRKLIGRLVRDEVALQCTVEELAEAANMSSPAMYQVFNADWSVSVLRLRSVEQALLSGHGVFRGSGAHARPAQQRVLGHGSWAAWCGASVFRSVEPRVMPSTRPAIWVRG